MNKLIQTFEPSRRSPKGPSASETIVPKPVKSTTTPTQNIVAWTKEGFFEPACVLTKYDMVIGIIGNTQGVKIASRPNPNAIPANGMIPSDCGVGSRVRRAAAAAVCADGVKTAAAVAST